MTDILEVLLACDLKKLKLLVKQGLDVNFQIPGTEGCTPLHIIVGIEKLEKKEKILSYLLEIGANPNARSLDDLTPVHIASMWNNCFELEKLLQNGGNPWLTDNENKNSFDMAADNNAYEAFQILNIYLAEDRLNFKDNSVSSQKNHKQLDQQILNSEGSFFYDSQKYMTYMDYLTANENFSSQISSTEDESETFLVNLSKFLKRKSLTKSKNELQSSERLQLGKTISEDISSKTYLVVSKSMSKNTKRDFNETYTFSSCESENSVITVNDLPNEDSLSVIDYDNQTGIVLVTEDSSSKNSIEKFQNSSLDSSCSDWKAFQIKEDSKTSDVSCSSHPNTSIIISNDLKNYSNSKIFEELQSFGDRPGPVLNHTRDVYLRRLAKLRSGCTDCCILPEPKYCPEIYLFLENKLSMTHIQEIENLMTAEFNDQSPDEKWREGNQRSCFNYFLLDPRVTQNLPLRAPLLSFDKAFMIFLDSLFYVGKGSKGRPYSHLLEAAKAMQNDAEKNKKVTHILDIWTSGLGVVSLHCFHNSIPVEAYTKEACIIEAVGLSNLTNIKAGDYYGISKKWTKSRKRHIGILLLKRALQIFLLEGEKQIKPKDVKAVK